MKLRTIALVGASFIVFATPAAAATGWYLGLGAGWSELKSIDYQRTKPAGASGGKIEFNTAVTGDIAAGFKMPSGVRVEIEDGFGEFKVKKATTPAGAAIAGAGGHVSVNTLLLNLAYDIPLGNQFGFTLGGGIGMGSVLAEYTDPIETNRRSDKAFAYQAIVGVTYAFSPQLDVEFAYHYVAVDNTSHDYSSMFGVPSGKINYGEADSHNLMLNLRWFP